MKHSQKQAVELGLTMLKTAMESENLGFVLMVDKSDPNKSMLCFADKSYIHRAHATGDLSQLKSKSIGITLTELNKGLL